MIFNINNFIMLIIFINFAVSNINNNLNYFIMKRLKKSRENLIKVADSICDVPFETGLFFFDEQFFINSGSVRLFSPCRTSFGSCILSMIPSNYHFRVSFEDGCLYLTIWL